MQINMGHGCSGADGTNNNENINNMSMEEIYNKIKIYTFATQDTALYLNTHPGDMDVLKRHNEYSKKLKEVNEAYEKFNNPIDNTGSSEGFWKYIEGPWAAQNMNWEDNE